MNDEIEAINGTRKKSMQEIIDLMQAQAFAPDAMTANAPVSAPNRGFGVELTVRKGSSAVVPTADGATPAPANLPVNADIRALMERAVAHLQLETDLASNELSQKRLEQNAAAYEKKHQTQMNAIDKQVAEARKQGDETALTKAFRWIGVAAATATATIASIASGGAATGLIVAAATALATAIGEESGGFKAIEKEISKSLQENQNMSKKDADEAAGYITMAISAAVQMAGDITGGFLTTAPEKVADAMIEEGTKVAANSVVGNMAMKTAGELGEAAQETVMKATEEIAKATEKAAEKAAAEGTKIVEKGVSEAVDIATAELSDKLVELGMKTGDVEKVMNGVKDNATKLMGTAEQIAKVQKAMFAVNAVISTAQTSGNTAENVQGIHKQREMRELDALQELAQTEEQRFLQKLSAENETLERIRKKTQDLQDSVIAMAQSRENSLQSIAQMI